MQLEQLVGGVDGALLFLMQTISAAFLFCQCSKITSTAKEPGFLLNK